MKKIDRLLANVDFVFHFGEVIKGLTVTEIILLRAEVMKHRRRRYRWAWEQRQLDPRRRQNYANWKPAFPLVHER